MWWLTSSHSVFPASSPEWDCSSTLKLVSEQLWVIQNTSCFNNLTAVVRGSCLLKSLEDLRVSSYLITFVPAFPATASVDNNPWPPRGFVPVTVSGWTLVSPVYILFPSFSRQSLTQLVMLSRQIRFPHCWYPQRPLRSWKEMEMCKSLVCHAWESWKIFTTLSGFFFFLLKHTWHIKTKD